MKEPRYLPPVELLEFFNPGKCPVGMRVVRLEKCEKCKSETSHTFTLVAPRFWLYECGECANPPPPED